MLVELKLQKPQKLQVKLETCATSIWEISEELLTVPDMDLLVQVKRKRNNGESLWKHT